MDKLFFISIAIVGVVSAIIGFLPEQKVSIGFKIALFVFIILCLFFQGWYGWKEKKTADNKEFNNELYQDKTLRGQAEISDDIKELKEKEKKGSLTGNDHSLYITRYLESIDHTLRSSKWKNTREWITAYYNETEKIPKYFSLEEWKESEKLIYDLMVNEITANLSARGLGRSSIRTKLLETFKKERERLLQAKERESNK